MNNSWQCFYNYRQETHDKQIVILKPNYEFLMWKLPTTEIILHKYALKKLNPYTLFYDHYMEAAKIPINSNISLDLIVTEIVKTWHNADIEVREEYGKLCFLTKMGVTNWLEQTIPKVHITHFISSTPLNHFTVFRRQLDYFARKVNFRIAVSIFDNRSCNSDKIVNLQCYGVTKDSETNNFMMVAENVSELSTNLEDEVVEYNLANYNFVEYNLANYNCNEPYTIAHEGWCKKCNAKRFQQDFPNWTSGNEFIDKYIQETQRNARSGWDNFATELSTNLEDDVVEHNLAKYSLAKYSLADNVVEFPYVLLLSTNLEDEYEYNLAKYNLARGISTIAKNLSNLYASLGNDDSEDYSKTFEWYIKSAKGKYKVIECRLDEAIYNWNIDEQKAFKLYQKVGNLGEQYGWNVDEQKAIELYQKAANLGGNKAKYGHNKGFNKAFEWYTKGKYTDGIRMLDYSGMEMLLIENYINGGGFETDFYLTNWNIDEQPKAFELYQRAANLGGNKAKYGHNKGFNKAFEWYTKGKYTDGIRMLDYNGMEMLLIENYINEGGFETDYYLTNWNIDEQPKAFELYKKAANLGDNKAQYDLNKNSFERITIYYNIDETEIYNKIAEEINMLGCCYYNEIVDEFNLYQKSAKNGEYTCEIFMLDILVTSDLANMYEIVVGVGLPVYENGEEVGLPDEG